MPLFIGPASSNISRAVDPNLNAKKEEPKKTEVKDDQPKPGAAKRAWDFLAYQAKYTAAFWAGKSVAETTGADVAKTAVIAAAPYLVFLGIAGCDIAPEPSRPDEGDSRHDPSRSSGFGTIDISTAGGRSIKGELKIINAYDTWSHGETPKLYIFTENYSLASGSGLDEEYYGCFAGKEGLQYLGFYWENKFYPDLDHCLDPEIDSPEEPIPVIVNSYEISCRQQDGTIYKNTHAVGNRVIGDRHGENGPFVINIPKECIWNANAYEELNVKVDYELDLGHVDNPLDTRWGTYITYDNKI